MSEKQRKLERSVEEISEFLWNILNTDPEEKDFKEVVRIVFQAERQKRDEMVEAEGERIRRELKSLFLSKEYNIDTLPAYLCIVDDTQPNNK